MTYQRRTFKPYRKLWCLLGKILHFQVNTIGDKILRVQKLFFIIHLTLSRKMTIIDSQRLKFSCCWQKNTQGTNRLSTIMIPKEFVGQIAFGSRRKINEWVLNILNQIRYNHDL